MAAFKLATQGEGGTSHTARDRDSLRHELVDAQVHLLNAYLDKRSAPDIVAALERLIDCCRASFEAEEGLMRRLRGQADPGHLERHHGLLARLEQLRLSALDADRGRLLANLIMIDRELIAHVADARKVEAGDGAGVTAAAVAPGPGAEASAQGAS